MTKKLFNTDRHCLSRDCLRGSGASNRRIAINMPESFNPNGCECRCSACYFCAELVERSFNEEEGD